jgi:hypothetical protein
VAPVIPQERIAQAREEVAMWNMVQRRPRARAAPRDRDDELDNNRGWLKRYPQMDISKMQDMDVYNRGVALQPFKVEYDSHEQINQKLNSTVILVKGHPFQVHGTIKLVGTAGYALLLGDRHGNLSWANYSDLTDFRTLAPGYINFNSTAYWVYRIPDRQNHQGMTMRNTYMKPAGDGRPQGMHPNTMMQALLNRKNIPFQPNLVELIENGVIQSIRLSNNVALHRVKNNGASCGVEYIGRPLGLVVGGRVKVLDDMDLGPTWIHKDCIDVSLELF